MDARVSLQVEELNLRGAGMPPRRAQRPPPPILIGGYVDAVLKRVATRGDGWLTYFYTPESYRRAWDKIVAFAREAGPHSAAPTRPNHPGGYGRPPPRATQGPLAPLPPTGRGA